MVKPLSASELFDQLLENYLANPEYGPLRNQIEEGMDAEIIDIEVWADEIGARLAIGFNKGALTFEFCDAIANAIFSHLVVTWLVDHPPPQFFMEVYDAFDAGEWHRSAAQDDDPIEEFTRPMIAEIVRKMRSIES